MTASGVLDSFTSDPVHDLLEELILRNKSLQAFQRSVAELRLRADRLGPLHPATLSTLQWTASVASLGGDRRTAEELLDALLSIRRRTLLADDPVLAETLIRRGRLARLLLETEYAEACLAEARRILDANKHDGALSAELEQAEAAMRLGTDLAGALERYRMALELRRSLTPPPAVMIANNLTWLGWTLDRLGRPQEAAPYLQEARGIVGSLGSSIGGLDTTLRELQADSLAFDSRWGEAAQLYRMVAETQTARRLDQLGGYSRRLCPMDGYDGLALAALHRGDGEAAWTLLQTGRGATYQDLAALGLWQARDRGTYAQARAVRRELADQTRELNLVRRGGGSIWTSDTWHLVVRVLELRGRLAELEADYLRKHRGWKPSIEKTRDLLGPRTALVGWLEGYVGGAPTPVSEPRRSWGYVYILRQRGPVVWIPLWDDRLPPEVVDAGAGWGEVFVRVRRAAEWPLRVGGDPLVTTQLREWTRHFFDAVLPHLAGIEHLVVEGTRVPVELFRDPEGLYLVDRYDISYVPSGAFLTLIAGAGHKRDGDAPRSALSMSAGEVEGGAADPLASALADRDRDLHVSREAFVRRRTSLDHLPPLRFAALEAQALARSFAVSKWLHGAGAEGDLRKLASEDRLRDYDVIHVATHTLVDGAPERCGLALTDREPAPTQMDDGVLDAEEILLGWKLDGALVTLSACESVRAAGNLRGEELGLIPALFAAGAGNSLVSLWPVDDRATALLMDRFYQNLKGRYAGTRLGRAGKPMPAAAALREAKIYLRDLADDRGEHPFQHPTYWAGFVLIGGVSPS